MLYPIYPQPYGSGFSVDVKCEFATLGGLLKWKQSDDESEGSE
jgi:hypothetical protein